MKAANDKIIVRSDENQKNTFLLNGIEISAALLFETNYREKSPVICQVVNGNNHIIKGDILLCHHNTFYYPSPYYLYDDLYSIPANGKIIFCKLNVHDGSLFPILGNMLCEKIDIKTTIPLPVSERKQYNDRMIVSNSGYCNYRKGEFLFTRPFAAYEIVYNWEGNLKRVYKCHEDQVCGILV